MPDAVMIDFRGPGMDEGLYDQVNQRVNPPDNPPQGMIFHSAGPLPGGGWRIVDVWETQEAFDKFAEEQIGPYSQQVGIEAPPETTVHEVHNHLAAS